MRAFYNPNISQLCYDSGNYHQYNCTVSSKIPCDTDHESTVVFFIQALLKPSSHIPAFSSQYKLG